MLEKRVLNTQIGDRLRTIIAHHARASDLKQPVPSLVLGRSENEPEERLGLGFYERCDIPQGEPIRLVEADGIEFLIIQDWLCDELDGKLVDFLDGKLVVLPQEKI